MSKAGRAGALYASLSAAQRLSSLLLLPLITRSVTPAEYGEIAVLVSLNLLLVTLLVTPVEQYTFRCFVRGQTADGSQRFKPSRWAVVQGPAMLAGISGLCLLAPALPFGLDGRWLAVELIATAATMHYSIIVLSLLRARQQMAEFALLSGLGLAVSVTGKLIFVVVLELGVFGWVLTDLISSIMLAVAGMMRLRSMEKTHAQMNQVPSEDFQSPPDLARFVGPLILHYLNLWAITYLSRLVAAETLDPISVGVFAVASNAASLPVMLMAEVNRGLVNTYAEVGVTTRSLEQSLRGQIYLGTATGLLAAGLARAFEFVFVPDTYVGVAEIIGLMSMVPLLWTIYVIPVNYMTHTLGRPGPIWIVSSAGSISTLAIGVVGANTWGMFGLAVAMVTAWSIMATVAWVVMSIGEPSGLGIATARVIVFPLVVSALSAIAAFVAPESAGWNIFRAGCLCVLALAWTRGRR